MIAERCGPDVRVHAVGPVSGVVRLPGSKSLTNRYLACAALADGNSILRRASMSDDARRMLAGLTELGLSARLDPVAEEIEVRGARGQIPAHEAKLDAGQAGTAMRFLTALCCLGHGRYRLDGSPRMRERPIGDLVDALRALGAKIGYEDRDGFPPLIVRGGGLGSATIGFEDTPSSQFVSAVLMAAPYAAGDVMIEIRGRSVSRPYLDLTLHVMRSLGVEVLELDGRYIVPAPQRYRGAVIEIEPDASGASYFWAAAAVTHGNIAVAGLDRASKQGDVRFMDVLARMGCQTAEAGGQTEVQGPASGSLRGVDVDLNDMPDTVQTLAVVALFAQGSTRIRNVANLRLKETDRLSALQRELSKLGARVDLHEDGLTIHPPGAVSPAIIDTYDDHRMAMSFSIAGLACEGIVIRNADCVSKSVPGFYDLLNGLRYGREAMP